jgi:hypothetical protein
MPCSPQERVLEYKSYLNRYVLVAFAILAIVLVGVNLIALFDAMDF